jgi:type III secretion protein C
VIVKISSKPGRRSAAVLALLMALTGPLSSQAGPAPWPDSAFSYYAQAKPLQAVLAEFAAGFSLSLDMPAALNTPVSGRFNGLTPTEFINRLGGIYGFTWFTHAGTLYVAGNHEQTVKAITAPGGSENLHKVLSNLHVLDPRFGWGELPGQSAVMVSGPPAYVRLVENTVAALPKSSNNGMQVAIFRLQHASAEDRTITYRNREQTTPGVARILRSLISGTTESATSHWAPVAGSSNAMSAAVKLSNSGTGLAIASGAEAELGNSGATEGAKTAPVAEARPVGQRVRPSIQSDPRLNAVIVQDLPDRMPIYQKMIATLDVPSPQIEIEAMIVDVNTSRLDELGIAWNIVGRGGGSVTGYGNVSATAADSNSLSLFVGPTGAAANATTLASTASRYLVSRIKALEEKGDASVQARPSVLTTENVGAVLDLSQTVYIQTTSVGTALVTPVTAGTSLRVTPRLEGQGDEARVRLYVDIEDGQVQTSTVAGALPTIQSGTVSTEASVSKDESLLLGGYNSIQTTQTQDKVPVLGDVPLFGALFSNTSKQVQRRERLFLIRAHVISPKSAPGRAVARPVPADILTGGREGEAMPTEAQPLPEAARARVVPPSDKQLSALRESMASAPPKAAAPPPVVSAGAPAPGADDKSRRVTTTVQNTRDRDARQVLVEELDKARARLRQQRARLAEGFANDEQAKTSVEEMRTAAARSQADIDALSRELARLPPALSLNADGQASLPAAR